MGFVKKSQAVDKPIIDFFQERKMILMIQLLGIHDMDKCWYATIMNNVPEEWNYHHKKRVKKRVM